MSKARTGWVVLAVVAGCLVLYAVIGLGVAQRSRALADRRPRPRQAQAAASQPVDVVGRRLRRIDVATYDGKRLSIPDGKQHIAVCLGDTEPLKHAAAGFKHLGALLPQIRFVLATVEPQESKGAARAHLGVKSVDPSLPPVLSPGISLVTADAFKLSEALGALLGDHRRGPGEWWLIDPSGRVEAYGEPGDAAPIMEADLAWPLLEPRAATPRGFKPTPVAQLSPDGADRRGHDRLLALWRQRLVEGYRQGSYRDARWDEPALAFLEQRSRALARHDTATDRTTLARLADRVLEAGCDDPVVIHECARVYDEARETNRGQALFARAPTLVGRGHYDDRQLYALGFVPRWDTSPGLDEARSVAYLRFGSSLTFPFAAGEQRIDAQTVKDLYLYGSGEGKAAGTYRQAAVEALSTPRADLWMRAWLDGESLKDKAWAARGLDWAVSKTQAKLEAFGVRLDSATKSLVLAWALHPDFPEPCELMVTVCMGQGDHNAARLWMERALAIDVDSPASSAYVTALEPLYGGSAEQMRAFAREMADDSLLATDTPLTLWRAAESIAAYSRAADVLRDPATVDPVLALLDRMTAAAATPQRQGRLRTYRLAVLVQAGRIAEAETALGALGDQLDLSAFTSHDLAASEALWSWLREHELGREALDKIAQLSKAQADAGARAVYASVRGKTDLAVIQRWIDDEVRGLDQRVESRKAAAMPDEQKLGEGFEPLPLDLAMTDWQCEPFAPSAGDLAFEAGGVLAYHRQGSHFFTYRTALPANVEVALELHTAGAVRETALLSLTQESSAGCGGPEVWLHSNGTADAHFATGKPNIRLEPRDWHAVRLRVKDGTAQAAVDGEDVTPPGPSVGNSGWHFRMVLDTNLRGEPMKVRGLQWRPL